MIRIEFEEPSTEEWKSWRQKCDAEATRAARHREFELRSGHSEKYEVDESLYKDARMKTVFKSDGPPFYMKCAYCELKIVPGQYGQIDHWRPKGGVRDLGNKRVMILRDDGHSEPHPGYYWLAYDWRNLLLACEECNGSRNSGTPAGLIGKGSRFPVRGFRARKMGEEQREDPLLLHPVNDEPSEHLYADPKDGLLDPLTPRGETCIRVFGLNREELVRDRMKSLHSIGLQLGAIPNPNEPDFDAVRAKLTALMRAIRIGEEEYAAFGRNLLARARQNFEDTRADQ